MVTVRSGWLVNALVVAGLLFGLGCGRNAPSDVPSTVASTPTPVADPIASTAAGEAVITPYPTAPSALAPTPSPVSAVRPVSTPVIVSKINPTPRPLSDSRPTRRDVSRFRVFSPGGAGAYGHGDDSPSLEEVLNKGLYAAGITPTHLVFRGTARDAFVWPSDVSATDGQRIANFPLNYPLGSETYVYQICTETFPSVHRDEWESLILHAIEQWKYSIDNIVTVRRSSDDCARYAAFIEAAADEVANLAPGVDATEHVEAMFELFHHHSFDATYDEAVDDDKLLNEIRMYDDVADANIVLLKDVGVFHELAGRFGHRCDWIRRDRTACTDLTQYGPGQYTRDVMIRRDHPVFRRVVPDVPGADDSFDDDDILLNDDCLDAYRVLVHEIGHVLGIGWGREPSARPLDAGHALVADSVMNYDHITGVAEPDCSPYPLDIMAVYAIYQTLD